MSGIFGFLKSAAQTGEHAALQISNPDFYCGDFKGLSAVNLDMARNRVTAFIGPSDNGKSTLLRACNRMFDLYPGQRTDGTIVFNGKNLLDRKQDGNLVLAKIGMAFQKPTAFTMSIYENIAFGVRLYERFSAIEMDERVEWGLRKAALWDRGRINSSGAACRFPVVSSSACALRGRWR